MIKDIAPDLRRAAIMYHPDSVFPKYMLPPFEAAAQALMVLPIDAPVRSDAKIETTIQSLGNEHGGLVIVAEGFTIPHRAAIISAAMRNKVPAIAQPTYFAREGCLLSYGPNNPDQFRRAAGYVDRILKGERTADLPVQLPIKFDLVINLKTAKALGLSVPSALLVFASELID